MNSTVMFDIVIDKHTHTFLFVCKITGQLVFNILLYVCENKEVGYINYTSVRIIVCMKYTLKF